MAPETPESSVLPVDPPIGMYPARLDDKGRLKLPVDFQNFFGAFPDKRVYITSLDGRIGAIYPISVWKANLKLMSGLQSGTAEAKKVLFLSNFYGGEGEVDSSGRVTVNPLMRTKLNLMGQELKLSAVRGRVEILNEELVLQLLADAEQDAPANVTTMENLGML